MRLLRSLFFYMVLFLSTVILGTTAILFAVLFHRSDWSHLCGRLWGNINLVAAGVSVIVDGLENLPQDRAAIYAANHQSWFDIFTILGKLPVQFRWLAKEELFRIPLFGQAMRHTGYIPIDRRDRKKAFRSLEEAANEVRQGTSIVIFPEGTRSPDGVIQPFKKGGIILAIRSQQPIVPISISGSYKILPKRGGWFINPGRIRMTIGKPIATEGCTIEDRNRIIGLVRDAIRLHLQPEEGGIVKTSDDLSPGHSTQAIQ